MATRSKKKKSERHTNGSKKTSIGNGKFSKFGNKGGGHGGTRPSKKYRKKSRGQGCGR